MIKIWKNIFFIITVTVCVFSWEGGAQKLYAADVVIDTPGNLSVTDRNWGADNIIIRDDGSASFAHLLMLSNCGLTGTYTGTGTLTLESLGKNKSEYYMIKVGENSLSPGERVFVDMNGLQITAKDSVSSWLYGIYLDGFSLGSGTYLVNNVFKTTGDTALNLENTARGALSGIHMQNTHYANTMDAEFQNLNAAFTAAGNIYGIRLSANSDGRNNFTVNKDVVLTADAGKQAYAVMARTNGLKGSNELAFKGVSTFNVTAPTAVGLYFKTIESGTNNVTFEKGTSFKSKGASAWGGWAASETGGKNIFRFLDTAEITTTSTGTGYAVGIQSGAESGSSNMYSFAGPATIRSIAENSYAYGMYFSATSDDALNSADFSNGLSLEAAAAEESTGIYASASGNNAKNIININGPTALRADYIVAAYGDGTTVNINQTGGASVRATGDLYAADGAAVNLLMDADGSFLRGNMISKNHADLNVTADGNVLIEGAAHRTDTTGADGVINLGLKNNAVWNVTAASDITKLDASAAVINMGHDAGYQTLTIGTLNGSGSVFRMDTDLASETDGDKIVITTAANGGKQYIEVNDASQRIADKVTGAKKLLLVSDASGNAVFEGKTYYGLWDTTPVVEKIGDDWYLTKLEYSPNPSTQSVVGAVEAGYGLWRNSILDDTLRKRASILRGGKKGTGAWARVKAGKLSADLFDGNYQTYQMGIDKTNGNNVYGAAIDYVRGSANYTQGSGDNNNVGLSLYNTNYRDDGFYSDIVIRAGRVSTEMKSFYEIEDGFDYKAWGYSMSCEVGKTIPLRSGWFVEPQAQLVYGHMRGGSYTTDRGIDIEKDAINSFIGRAGFIAGRNLVGNSAYYIKANIYREFAGDGDMTLRLNGQQLYHEGGHSDTWLEVGGGINVKLSEKAYLYGDILKTFGADIEKKWQINLGVSWEF